MERKVTRQRNETGDSVDFHFDGVWNDSQNSTIPFPAENERLIEISPAGKWGPTYLGMASIVEENGEAVIVKYEGSIYDMKNPRLWRTAIRVLFLKWWWKLQWATVNRNKHLDGRSNYG